MTCADSRSLRESESHALAPRHGFEARFTQLRAQSQVVDAVCVSSCGHVPQTHPKPEEEGQLRGASLMPSAEPAKGTSARRSQAGVTWFESGPGVRRAKPACCKG